MKTMIQSIKKEIARKSKIFKEKVKENFRILGKSGSILSFIIAVIITLSPSIGLALGYYITGDNSLLISAGSWIAFLIAPAGGTMWLIFFGSLFGASSILIKIKKK